MAEEQALDRVHRIGQTQPVVATRYIVGESVEEVRIPCTSLTIFYLADHVVGIVCRFPAEKEAGSDPAIAWTKRSAQTQCAQGETESEISPSPCMVVPLADDGQSLHDFLTSSSTRAAVQ